MKYAKIMFNGEARWGVLEDGVISLIEGTPYSGVSPTGESVIFEDAELLAPCDPTKIVCIGKNYLDHAVEFGEPVPKNPTIFIKPTTSLNNPGGEIEYPSASKRVDYEGEFGFVIRKTAKKVRREDAAEYILGYTCVNDVTARDIQKNDEQWARGKGYDTFCPVGPILTDEFDPASGRSIKTFLNGELRQNATTDLLMWDVPYLLEFITDCMTLLPGDIVSTGTPVNVGPMQRGDRVRVVVEGIGELENTVK
ncbi:MAG: fumarylacetoacetate hydrolase family protein [Clostridiales bacterium]|nr:fumarylacetoacetate hydrolase family protein [Clostridiales bacterium]